VQQGLIFHVAQGQSYGSHKPVWPLLDHVIGSALLKAVHRQILADGAREEYERHLRQHPFCNGKPGQAVKCRHAVIGYDEIDATLMQSPLKIFPGLNSLDFADQPFKAHHFLNQNPVAFIIFKMQHSNRRHFFPGYDSVSKLEWLS
jgi:hypothetical protein